MRDLRDVRGEEQQVDRHEAQDPGDDHPQRLLPQHAHDHEEEDRVDEERAGDGDAVGRCELRRAAEPDHERHDRDEQRPVHRGHVDLPDLLLRRVSDLQPREEPELHRLPGDGERPRDHGLRGDERRHRREHHHRHARPLRHQQVEGARDRGRVVQDQGALAHVVQGERREDDEEPRAADGPPAEVAHVGVERLGPRHREHHGPERDERDPRVPREELHGVVRRERPQDRRVVDQPADPGRGQHHEPDHHDRPEDPADDVRPVALDGEQPGQDREGEGEHDRLELRGGDLDALDRGEHGDRGRDHAVAVEQRDAEEPGDDQRRLHPRALQPGAADERDEGHDAALALVVRPHDERHELDRDDQRDGPDDQRDDPVDVALRRLHGPVVGREDRLQRVQGARPDVAEDDAEGPEGQGRQPRVVPGVPRAGGRHRAGTVRLPRRGVGRGAPPLRPARRPPPSARRPRRSSPRR